MTATKEVNLDKLEDIQTNLRNNNIKIENLEFKISSNREALQRIELEQKDNDALLTEVYDSDNVLTNGVKALTDRFDYLEKLINEQHKKITTLEQRKSESYEIQDLKNRVNKVNTNIDFLEIEEMQKLVDDLQGQSEENNEFLNDLKDDINNLADQVKHLENLIGNNYKKIATLEQRDKNPDEIEFIILVKKIQVIEDYFGSLPSIYGMSAKDIEKIYNKIKRQNKGDMI